MSFLRGSLNYVWCTTSVLGKGATGSVFQVCNASRHSIKIQTNTMMYVNVNVFVCFVGSQ